MITKEITLNRYDDCNECPFIEFPDEDGIIYKRGYKIRLSKTVISKENTVIPNPIIAYCSVDSKPRTNLHGCNRWFNNLKEINYV